MPLLLDVLQVVARRPVCRIFLTHVAKPAGKFGESLAIGALAEPMNLQVIGFEENGAGEEGDYRVGIEQGGFSKKKEDYQLGAAGGAAWCNELSFVQSPVRQKAKKGRRSATGGNDRTLVP